MVASYLLLVVQWQYTETLSMLSYDTILAAAIYITHVCVCIIFKINIDSPCPISKTSRPEDNTQLKAYVTYELFNALICKTKRQLLTFGLLW